MNKTVIDDFVRGSVFEVNPGGTAKVFRIGIAANCEVELIDDLTNVWFWNPSWFKTIKRGG